MISRNQIAFAAAKSLVCVLTLCICLFTAGFVITRVQASGASGTGGLVAAQQFASAQETEVLPANETGDADEEEAPSSDPPGSTDQHNSSGDDVVIRIPR
ncbi:MAG: hypothetical protein ABI977_23380 [Acidobacteriota bacterium]